MKLLVKISLFFAFSIFGSIVGATNYPELTREIYELATFRDNPEKECRSGEYARAASEIKALIKIEHDVDLYIFCVPKAVLLNDDSHTEGVFLIFPQKEIYPPSKKQAISLMIANYISDESLDPEYCENPYCSKDRDQDAASNITAVEFAKKKYDASEMKLHGEIEFYIAGGEDTSVGLIEYVQWVLKQEGYYRGGIDGKWGKRSESALKKFLESRAAEQGVLEQSYRTGSFIKAVIFDRLLTFDDALLSEDEQNLDLSNGRNINDEAEVGALDEHLKEISSDHPAKSLENSDTSQPTLDFVDDKAPSDGGEGIENQPYLTELEILKQYSKELQAEKNSLQDKIDEQDSKTRELIGKLKEANDRLSRVVEKSIRQLWDDAKVDLPTIEGVDPSGDTLSLDYDALQFIDNYSCRFNIDQPILKQLQETYTDSSCFQVQLREYDEDRLGVRRYDAIANTLIIPVQEKQNDFIKSIVSTHLEGFNEEDTYSCYVGLSLLAESQSNIEEEASNLNIIPLYLEASQGTGVLSDGRTIKPSSIEWKGRYFRLVENQKDIVVNSCLITSDNLIPIVEQNDDPNDLAPIAIISRDGSITLKNLPVVKKKTPELHLFLDTLVGPEGDQQYGFNNAISNSKAQRTQKIYFEGFLRGIQSFLSTNENIRKVTIHHTVLDESKNRDLIEVAMFERDELVNGDEVISDEFITNYMATFSAGIPGEFDNKKRSMSKLLDMNGNSVFVSFGSSGYNPGRVCQGTQPRRDYNTYTLIFDVVPGYTIDRLNENGDVTELEQGFAYKCKAHAKITPMRPLSTRTVDDVLRIVESQMMEWRN